MSSAVDAPITGDISQGELLRRGREKLAAFRQTKAANRQQIDAALQQIDAHISSDARGQQPTNAAQAGNQHTQQSAHAEQPQQTQPATLNGASTHQPQPQLNGHHHDTTAGAAHSQHSHAANMNGNGHSAVGAAAATNGAAATTAEAQAQSQAATAAAAPAVTVASVHAMQQQYEAYYAQYGTDPQYAAYFHNLLQQIQQAQYYLQQQQMYEQQQQQQQAAAPHPVAAAVQPTIDGVASAAPAASAASAVPDYASSTILQSFTPEQRASFLGFAQYYHEPTYAAYYDDMRTKAEYAAYFQTMDAVMEELRNGNAAAPVATAVTPAAGDAATTQSQQAGSTEQAPSNEATESHSQSDSTQSQQAADLPHQSSSESDAAQQQQQPAPTIEHDLSSYFSQPSQPTEEEEVTAPVPTEPVASEAHSEPVGKMKPTDSDADQQISEQQHQQQQQQQHQQQQQQQQQQPQATEATPEQSVDAPSAEHAVADGASSDPYPPASAAAHADAASSSASAAPAASPAAPSSSSDEMSGDAAFSTSSSAAATAIDYDADRRDGASTPSAAELPSTVSLDASPFFQHPDAIEQRSTSPVLLDTAHSRSQSMQAISEAVQFGGGGVTEEEQPLAAQLEDMPPLDHFSEVSADTSTQQQQDYSTQQQQRPDQYAASAQYQQYVDSTQQQHPESAAAQLKVESGAPDGAADRAAVLAELESLRAALQQKDAELLHLTSSLPGGASAPHPHHHPHQHSSALMSSSSSDSLPSASQSTDLLREGSQVANLSRTVSSLSQEVDSLRLENQRLLAQQSLLRSDVAQRNQRMEQVQHDNVALLLEMDQLEKEVSSMTLKVQEAQAAQAKAAEEARRAREHGGGGSVDGDGDDDSSCSHGALFAELHELQLQLAPIWAKSVQLTAELSESIDDMQHSCALTLQGVSSAPSTPPLRLLINGMPSGISATPAGTSSSTSSTTREEQQQQQHARSSSDPQVALEHDGSEQSTALVPAGDEGATGLSTPPRKASSSSSSSSSSSPSASSSSLVPVSSLVSVQSSLSSLLELVRTKAAVEGQMRSLLQRVDELVEPVSALLGVASHGRGTAAGEGGRHLAGDLVRQSIRAMQQKSFAASSSSSSDELSELRQARDALSAQLAAQVERTQVLIKDKIHLAKRIEDTYEERQIVVENLREEIAALRAAMGEQVAGVPHAHTGDSPAAAAPGQSGETTQPQQSSQQAPSNFEQYYQRYDSALGDVLPAGSSVRSSEEARALNHFYVTARRSSAQQATSPSAAASGASAATPTSPQSDASATPTATPSTDEQADAAADDDDDDDEGVLVLQPEPQRGLFSSLLSFFRVRFSQAAYEQAMREAHRRRRAARSRQQQANVVDVVVAL